MAWVGRHGERHRAGRTRTGCGAELEALECQIAAAHQRMPGDGSAAHSWASTRSSSAGPPGRSCEGPDHESPVRRTGFRALDRPQPDQRACGRPPGPSPYPPPRRHPRPAGHAEPPPGVDDCRVLKAWRARRASAAGDEDVGAAHDLPPGGAGRAQTQPSAYVTMMPRGPPTVVMAIGARHRRSGGWTPPRRGRGCACRRGPCRPCRSRGGAGPSGRTVRARHTSIAACRARRRR